MKLGFATVMAGGQLSFEEVVRWAAQVGFDCVEVMGRNHLDPRKVLHDGPGAMLNVCRETGVSIAALAPMLNLLDIDSETHGERVEFMIATIDAAAALEVPVVVTYGGSAFGMYFWGFPSVGANHPSNKVGENLKIFADVYGPLSERAERVGVRIAFETAPRGGGYGNVAHCPELWDRMFDCIPSPALGLSLDPSHLVWLHIPVEETIRAYGSRIYHVDGKDCDLLPERLRKQGILGNQWWRYRIPGYGELNWANIVSCLKEVGYDGAIDIENEDRLFPGQEGLLRALRHLRQVMPEQR